MSARPSRKLPDRIEPATAIAKLIPVGTSNIANVIVQTTSARDLHVFLKVNKDFSAWIKAQIGRARLVEGRDYICSPLRVSSSSGTKHSIEYHLTLEAGKHVAMLSETEKGFEVREYFIECERRALSGLALPNFADPAAAARAWADEVEAKRALASKAAQLEHQVAEQAPAVAGLKLIADASGSMCFRDAAATLNMPQHALTDYLVSKGWIYERAGAEGYKAYRARLQALDLRYNTFGYESKTTGERKARQQVRITNKGLTRLAEMIAEEAEERKLSAGTPQHQQRLGLDPS